MDINLTRRTPPFTRSRGISLFLALALLVTFVALQVLLGLLMIVALLLLQVAGTSAESAMSLAENGVVVGGASALAGLLMLGLIWLVVSRAGRHPFRAPMALVPAQGWPFWTFPLLAIVVALVFDGLTALLGQPLVPEILVPYFRGPVAVLVMACASVLIAPVVEELLFRGVLFGALERFGPPWLAVLLTALPFGLLHVMTYGPDWYTILQTLVMGLILGGLRAWTRSLWPGIVFHAIHNLYATLEVIVLVNVLTA